MKFELKDGALWITSQGQRETAELIKELKLDVVDHLPQLNDGELVYRSYSEKRQWYQVQATLGPEWLKPYFDLLHRYTGFEGNLELESAPHSNYKNFPVQTDAVFTDSYIQDGCYCAEGYKRAQDWQGKPAEEQAFKYFEYSLKLWIGLQTYEPEYIMGDYGREKKNPKYPQSHPPKPALDSSVLFAAIFKEWEKKHATDGQKALIAKGVEWDKKIRSDFYDGLPRDYQGFYVDPESRHVSWEEFKAA